MSLPEHAWDRTEETLNGAAAVVAARLSRDDVAPSSAVRQPVIPNLRRTAAPARGAYTILSASKIFCHPDGNIFVCRPDAR
jgi:hypothetical protein